MDEISTISDTLLELEKGLTTLQNAIDKIEDAKDITFTVVNNTIQVQDAVNELVRKNADLLREVQSIGFSDVRSLVKDLGVDLQQVSMEMKALEDAQNKRFDVLTDDMIKLEDRIDAKNKDNFKKILSEIESKNKKQNTLQIAQLVASILIIILIIISYAHIIY